MNRLCVGEEVCGRSPGLLMFLCTCQVQLLIMTVCSVELSLETERPL
jgi:hypothetical protein